jgi:energy-coupling factor transporter transmembrane protein EcfT
VTEARLRPGVGVLLLGSMAGSFVAARLETALGCLALSLAVAWLAAAPRPARGWFLSLAGGSLVAIVLNAYLVAGRDLGWPVLFGRAATLEGVRHGVLLALRLVGAAVALKALAAVWPGERAADEIARLMGPLERIGVPVRDLRSVVGLALRFGPLLPSELGRIRRLQEQRAGRRGSGIRERIEDVTSVVVPAMVSTLERAERVALALEARHYGTRSPAAATGGRRLYAIGAASVLAIALVWRG